MLSERLGQMSDLDIINVTHKRDGADPSLIRICSIAQPESVAIDRVNHNNLLSLKRQRPTANLRNDVSVRTWDRTKDKLV